MKRSFNSQGKELSRNKMHNLLVFFSDSASI